MQVHTLDAVSSNPDEALEAWMFTEFRLKTVNPKTPQELRQAIDWRLGRLKGIPPKGQNATVVNLELTALRERQGELQRLETTEDPKVIERELTGRRAMVASLTDDPKDVINRKSLQVEIQALEQAKKTQFRLRIVGPKTPQQLQEAINWRWKQLALAKAQGKDPSYILWLRTEIGIMQERQKRLTELRQLRSPDTINAEFEKNAAAMAILGNSNTDKIKRKALSIEIEILNQAEKDAGLEEVINIAHIKIREARRRIWETHMKRAFFDVWGREISDESMIFIRDFTNVEALRMLWQRQRGPTEAEIQARQQQVSAEFRILFDREITEADFTGISQLTNIDDIRAHWFQTATVEVNNDAAPQTLIARLRRFIHDGQLVLPIVDYDFGGITNIPLANLNQMIMDESGGYEPMIQYLELIGVSFDNLPIVADPWTMSTADINHFRDEIWKKMIWRKFQRVFHPDAGMYSQLDSRLVAQAGIQSQVPRAFSEESVRIINAIQQLFNNNSTEGRKDPRYIDSVRTFLSELKRIRGLKNKKK